MNSSFVNQAYASAFVVALITVIVATILSFCFASHRAKLRLRIIALAGALTAGPVLILSPDWDQQAKKILTPTDLSPGRYAVENVWRVNKACCAILRPVHITSIDLVNKTGTSHEYLSPDWILCDVTGTDVVGNVSPASIHPFTGYAIVESINGKSTIRMFNPFTEK